MLYDPNEMKTSQQQLRLIFKSLREPVCLLGGWAVYHIVNENFEKANGRPYIGSRDIDIGFHIDKDWTEKQLIESDFVSAVSTIEKLGFSSVSFRLVKNFDMDTGKELSHEEATKLPLYQIFQLFIDPVVDHIHPEIKDVLGFVPIDEPFLSFLFQNRMCTAATIFGRKAVLPTPELLLAMKLNSAPRRDKENKRIKDIADIYALTWHSSTSLPSLKNQLSSIEPRERTRKTVRTFTEEDLDKVSRAIGVPAKEITRVLAELE
ncbi:MAG: hypothetical protein ACLFU9_02925 [Candidatus Bathyarchaeia archaeon]